MLLIHQLNELWWALYPTHSLHYPCLLLELVIFTGFADSTAVFTFSRKPACSRAHRTNMIVQMIEPVAERLSIPKGNIFANRLIFDAKSGEYMGFDENEPTSRDGGKPKVVSM